MFLDRFIKPRIEKLKTQFPIVGILGPRQSGKTTLARNLFSKYKYINLEEIDNREFATNDPRGFLKSLEGEVGAILDEIQRVPSLLSYLQAYVDEKPSPGFFILTGSENILLNHHIGQTLAGRIALVTLLPFSLGELQKANRLDPSLEEVLFQGFYPPIHAKKIEPKEWIQSYIQTYIERDVRNLKQISDLSLFQKFLKLCAGRVGQLLDLTAIGSDCGISTNTVRAWISILEATYVVFLLHPHHKNFSKRLIKSPKLYFYDSAVACHLLSIQSAKELTTHYLRGGLFESMILSDLLKQRFNAGHLPNLYFWRDKSGCEIDCILDEGTKLIPIEIKSGATISSDYFSNLLKWNEISETNPLNNYVIYSGVENQARSSGSVISWQNLDDIK
jgi:predicted AAA+ superfamily ATPase